MNVSYLAPAVSVKAGDLVFDTVSYLEVDAARGEPAASCVVRIPDVRRELRGKLVSGADISVDWGYKGQDLSPIFTGVVRMVKEHRREVHVHAIDRAAALLDTRITRTYQDETPTTIVRSLLAEAGIEAGNLPEETEPLDRLPLQDSTLWWALVLMERRAGTGRVPYFDQEGAFRWERREDARSSGYTLEYAKNILRYEPRGTRLLVETVGLPLHHSVLVDVVGPDGERRTWFVGRVRHTLGPEDRGSRTVLWLEEWGET